MKVFAIVISFFMLPCLLFSQDSGVIKGRVNIDRGEMIMERFTQDGSFDTVQVAAINPDSTFLMDNVPTGDYILSFWPDERDRDALAFQEQRAYPKLYFDNTVRYDSASLISIKGDSLEIQIELNPITTYYTAESDVEFIYLDGNSPNQPDEILVLVYFFQNSSTNVETGQFEEGWEFQSLQYLTLNLNEVFNELLLPDLSGLYRMYLETSTGLRTLDTEAYVEFEVSEGGEEVDLFKISVGIYPDSLMISIVEELAVTHLTPTIYPNPASDYLTIVDEEPLAIIDMSGRIHSLQYIGPDKLDISHLPQGVYFLQMKDRNIVHKFVKQ